MKQFLFDKKILIIFFLILLSGLTFIFKPDNTIPIALAETEPKETIIYVDIKGEVENPGVYQIEEGKIVKDAIALAGGITNLGTTENINLSIEVYNEMVIVIPKISEEPKLIENNAQMESVSQAVSLNNGTLEELQTLSGIGESKAKAIIEYRKKFPFTSIDEIINVQGIGVATYEKNKDRLTL